MPSEFDILASEFVAPALMESHADSQSLRIIPHGGMPAVVDAVLSTPTVAFAQDPETGEIVRREQMTARVLRSKLDAENIDRNLGLKTRLTIIATNEAWNWDQDTTRWGPAFVTLGMIRKPLVRKPEPHRAIV